MIALYVLEESNGRMRPPGGASRWWLAGSLRSLSRNLGRLGTALVLRRGRAADVLRDLVRQSNANALFWNRRYGHAGAADRDLANDIRTDGISVETFNASLLFEPGAVRTKAGGAMRVFTPFWRAARASGDPRLPRPTPKRMTGVPGVSSDELDSWRLEPTRPDWAGEMRETWERGEDGARKRLTDFIDASLPGYAKGRDHPAADNTSRLSPYLRFGEISPYQIWHAAKSAEDRSKAAPRDVDKFLSELGWREFSYQLLDQFPDLADRNFQSRFDAFPWQSDDVSLDRWRRGQTGYPLVDAGMRQLWRTGYMHNRVRMVVASFLVKHLLVDWREGERWFWDTLVDADPANNPASWQWVAGSGADAAPYFRVFNPTLQSEKFDPDGGYVQRWIPEIAHLPAGAIHAPTRIDAPDYPQPIVDHAKARARALEAFAVVRGSSE